MKLTRNKIFSLLMFGALQSQFVFAEDLASILQLSLQQDPVLTEANANTGVLTMI